LNYGAGGDADKVCCLPCFVPFLVVAVRGLMQSWLCYQNARQRLAKYVHNRDEQRSKFSRRRTHVEGEAVDYINDRNRHFNKKIGRFFDKYSTEIKQNLERGTAL